ncbi:hypothetical protein XELAEV_18027019mg [Xenopus laevis]|uniref:Uncharacterized protein n=1 Tax=Xenopus laevis TaxID=8355 RepID=A0A974HJK0_XENLA|nr:hypothetical protein XELAEV_18027019mg [Xenopus laevis]
MSHTINSSFPPQMPMVTAQVQICPVLLNDPKCLDIKKFHLLKLKAQSYSEKNAFNYTCSWKRLYFAFRVFQCSFF